MIGNDIIDLAAARIESNWKRKGYLQKLYSEAEQLLITNAADPEIMLWCLWSMKESAYKIYNRQTKIRSYMPLRLNCYDLQVSGNLILAKVFCQGNIYFTKTIIHTDYIHTTAAVSEGVIDSLNIGLYTDVDSGWRLNPVSKDKYGHPYLIDKNTFEKLPVSISHHGRFCSYIST